MTLEFLILESPENPAATCEVRLIIEKLYKKKLLIYNASDLGNCFEIAAKIIPTLDKQGFEIDGWFYVVADCINEVRHCWLEHQGWVIDFSSGQSLFIPIEDFYRIREVTNERRYTIEELRALSKNPSVYGLAKYFDY